MRPEGISKHIERVVGGKDAKVLDIAVEDLQRYRQETSEKFSAEKKELNEREAQLSEMVARHVGDFVERYGGKRRVFAPGEIRKIAKHHEYLQDGGGGKYDVFQGDVVVEEADEPVFVSALAHERLHASEPASMQVKYDSLLLYRQGLGVSSRTENTEYFYFLEEAIVEEGVRKISEDIATDPLVREAMAPTREVRRWLRLAAQQDAQYADMERLADEILYIADADKILDALKKDEPIAITFRRIVDGVIDADEEGRIRSFDRFEERNHMYELFDQIIEKSNGEFTSRDQVYDMFAKANFSGRLLPLARKVDGILGEGAFRKIGEDFARRIDVSDDDQAAAA